MSQENDAGTEREQVPPSAVYRQLDDHLGPEEAPYDAESGLQRLRGWMGDEEPPDEARPQAVDQDPGATPQRLAQDQRQHAKTKSTKGEGDRGDR